ncbi:MAG TPA: hypothetical protein DDW55_00305 [Gammaproteobacteria bacterium]|nr:hypothetical protein [Gammaproteobacteria bacterium]
MNAWAAENLMPFVMVSNTAGDAAAVAADTKGKLEAGGFKVLGEYSPYAGANVIVATSDALLAQAAKSDFGGYGAVVRVAVTKAGDKVQVAYANPIYWAAAYQMQDLGEVAGSLKQALGGTPYGSESGLSDKKLRKYHYMAFMPYFKDHDELGSFGSHSEAVAKVNEHLASGANGLTKIFEVSLPGKDETLIGVGISQGDGSDAFVMERVDKADMKHTAHLPYAVLVSGNDVYSLAGKFRIALSFPDLTMGTFGSIMSSPGAIKDSLGTLAK